MSKKTVCFFFILVLVVSTALAERQRFVEFTSYHVDMDVSKVTLSDDTWKTAKPYRQPLQRQFLEVPKPAEIGVEEVWVQSINDGKYIAFSRGARTKRLGISPAYVGIEGEGGRDDFSIEKIIRNLHFWRGQCDTLSDHCQA